jgi:RNA polymerase sigma-70 factor (ECF subfamily)
LISESDRIRSQLLALRIRNGDDKAFGELVSLWELPLFYYTRKFSKCEEDAWDVLQETWIRIFRGIGKLNDLSSLPAWLYRIARNAVLNYNRDNRKMDNLVDDDLDTEAIGQGGDHDFSTTDAEAIHWGLKQLPVNQRDVLILLFLEEFTIKEIASITGVSEGTVKSRLHYAKKALYGLIEKEFGNE